MMRALGFHQTGGPEVLEVVEVPRPAAGPGQILVRNHAVGVNFVDTAIRRGKVPHSPAYSLPVIVGQEGAGVIVALGEGVQGPLVGTRVLWMDFPFDAHGYAEYSVVRANNVVAIHDHVSFESAAAAPCVYSAARNQVFNYYGRAKRGDWALVRNAAGAAGVAMVETATEAGLKVIAVTTAQKLDFTRLHGAIEALDYKKENVPERVREITGGKGVALALNAVGGETIVEDVNLLAPCGQLVSYGLIAGMPTPEVWSALTRRISESLTYSVVSIIASMRENPIGFRGLLEQITADLSAGRLRPSIFEAIPLFEGVRAHRMLEGAKNTGKVVLTVDH
jgi:NADPH2:quinone reductase